MHEIMEWAIREMNLTALLTQVSTRVPQQWIYFTMHGGHCAQHLLLSSNYFPKSAATGTATYYCILPWYNISVLYHRECLKAHWQDWSQHWTRGIYITSKSLSFPPPSPDSDPSLKAQIPALGSKSQPLGPNPSLEAQIPTLRPKSQS